MNTHIRTVGLLTIAFYTVNAQAFNFKITNYTPKPHNIQLKLMTETWQTLGTVAPQQSIEKKFGPQGNTISDANWWKGGFCLERLSVDGKTEILNVDDNQIDQIMRYKDNPKDLDMYLASSGIYSQIIRASICQNKKFLIVEIPTGFAVLATTLQ